MSAANCAKGNSMPEIWAIIAAVIISLILVSFISSKLTARRQRKQREKSLPFVEDNVRVGVSYNVYMNDGRKFLACQLAGTSDDASGKFIMGGWEGMLVILQSNGKRAFVRQGSVRCIEEA
jgi:hypothetical protein